MSHAAPSDSGLRKRCSCEALPANEQFNTRLLDIRDELAVARDFVGCLYLACQQIQERDEGSPLSTVLYDVREKLRAIGGSVDGLIGSPPDQVSADEVA